MPIDRPADGDRPAGRAEPLAEQVRRAADAEAKWEAAQGYDESYFRDPRPKDGLPGAPPMERVLWYRYHDAYERAGTFEGPRGQADQGDRRQDVHLPREVQDEARQSLPDVPNPREEADRKYSTDGHVFGPNGFLRMEESGGWNPDGKTRDSRVGEAMQMMTEDLAWYGLGGRKPETHVEVKTAVDMIEGRLPKHVAIVINNEVCVGRKSCDEFIRARLPVGYSLRVYDYNGNEWFHEGTYEGGSGR